MEGRVAVLAGGAGGTREDNGDEGERGQEGRHLQREADNDYPDTRPGFGGDVIDGDLSEGDSEADDLEEEGNASEREEDDGKLLDFEGGVLGSEHANDLAQTAKDATPS